MIIKSLDVGDDGNEIDDQFYPMEIPHFGNSEIVLRAPSICNARDEFVILTGGEDYNASSLLA